MMDFNKEIKLSDLFRRRSKDPAEDLAAEPESAKPAKQRRSLFARRSSDGAQAEPKPPKQPRERRRLFGRTRGETALAKDAPAVPRIPLMRAFDLMPKEMERERNSRMGMVQIGLALLGLLVLAGLAGAYMFTSATVTTKQGEVDALRTQLAEIEVPSEAPEPGSPLAGEGQPRTAALSTALAQRIAWDRVLREVSLVIPDDVYLIQLSASTPNAGAAPPPTVGATGTSPNTLALVGFAESQESVAVLLSRLAAIPELTSVQLQSSSKSGGESGGQFQFSVLAGVDPLGAAAS
jgi:Tfp pilus assembly protein PilN